MCGITGIWYFDQSKTVSQDLLRGMVNTLIHRGPDEEDTRILQNIGMGFRRLSIIDLVGSSQPMYNETGSIWLVFNGEIYNYQGLRSGLMAEGHHFYTNGDAEVILHSYEHNGLTWCLNKIRAMFSLALWDDRFQKMMLAVDPFGKKPLYYALDTGKLVFASEIKALLQHPGISKELDPKAIDEYFTYGCISAPKSIFRSIRKVQPGHYIVIDASGQAKITCYWKPHFAPSSNLIHGSLPELAEQLYILLLQAVQRRMISDVPLGAFLSGGVDSSSVVALMSLLSNQPIKTFSIGFEDINFDESQYAHQIAHHLSTEHYHMTIQPKLEYILPLLSQQYDEPHADSSSIPTYYVSKMAHSCVKVVLSGDGGDEIFGGYKAYQLALQAAWNQTQPELNKCVVGLDEEYRHIKEFRPEECYVYFYDDERKKLFLPGVIPFHCAEQIKQIAANEMSVYDVLTQFQYVDLVYYLPFDILTKVDRMSMLNSLEVRCPLLDRDVFEFMSMVPPEYKFNGLETKIILKRSVEHLLPWGVLNRPKKGFSIPLGNWLRGPWKQVVEDLLFSQQLCERGMFNPHYLRKLFDDHCLDIVDNSERIWSVICFELWAREYLDIPLAKVTE